MCYLFLIISKYNISPPQGQTRGFFLPDTPTGSPYLVPLQREAAPVGTATPKKHMATT